MLFKISVKNIRKSFKDYAVYFFTLILGVAVFYVFNAIDSQTVMLDVRKNVYDIIHFLRREMLDFTAFPVFFVSNLLLVQSKIIILIKILCHATVELSYDCILCFRRLLIYDPLAYQYTFYSLWHCQGWFQRCAVLHAGSCLHLSFP